jgi:hypothetical protein
MILKVRSCGNPEVWNFFDGVKEIAKENHHNVDSEILSQEKTIGSMVVRADVYDFTVNTFSKEEIRDGFLELWLFGKTNEDTKQILCYGPAYLLNDDGKTIERF